MSEGTAWPGQQNSPVPMLTDGNGWATAFGPQVLGRWTGTEQDVVPTTLQWDAELSVGVAFQGFVGGRFILGGIVFGSTPKWAEFDQVTGALLAQGDFGDRLNRWAAFTPTHSGGLAGLLYADPMAPQNPNPVNEVWFDAFHRTNLKLPPLPPGTNPPLGYPWWFQRFKFPTTMGTNAVGSMLLSAVQGEDGRLRVFVTRDSSGTIGQAVFRVGCLGMTLLDWNERFIGSGLGDISPSGEIPAISAVVDHHNGRMLIAYQNQPHRDHPFLMVGTHPLIMSRWAITEVKYDGTTKLLGVTPWWGSHIAFPKPVIVPRQDGIWFVFDCVEKDGTQHWKIGRFVDGVFQVMGRLPYGSVISYSKDGWLLFMDRTVPGTETSLYQIQFGPKLTDSRNGATVQLNWTPHKSDDLLQQRLSWGDWQSVPYIGPPPVTLQASSPDAQFRVVQNVPTES